MAVVTQPTDKNCNVDAPCDVDPELKEFWSGNPWRIFREHNLSCYERNRAYLNIRGQNFIEISSLTAADLDGDTRSAMAVDLRNTGQLDLIVRQVGGGPFKILRNQFPARHFLKVSLRGKKSNRLGIGARLVATVGQRKIVRELYPANSYRSQVPSLVHFGLDQAEKVDQLDVLWPSGEEQTLRDLPADRHIVIEEGSDAPETVQPGTTIRP